MTTLPDLRLPLLPSRLERCWRIGLHGLVVPAPLGSGLPLWLAVLCSLGLLGLALREIRRPPNRPARAQGLTLQGQTGHAGSISLQRETGPDWQGHLQGRPFVHPWLIVLPLRGETGERLRLVLWPDSAHPDHLRQLRVRLHYLAAASGKAPTPRQ
jgi:hypothetical protein